MATGTRKKTTQKKKTTGTTASKARKQREQQESFRNEVILWIALAVCIVLLLANFGIGGKIGSGVSSFFFGIFGLMAYVFPICFFLAVVFAVSNRENKVAAVKIVAAVLFVSFLCLFVQMVTDSSKEAGAISAFRYGFENKAGGGIIGGLLEQLLCPNFGVPGTYVIDIIVLIISLVLITERSIMKGMQKGGKVIYDSAKDDAIRRMDAAKERREEREKEREKEQARRRMEKKVSGVALDTKLPSPDKKKVKSDDINEITLSDIEDMPVVQEENKVALTAANGSQGVEQPVIHTLNEPVATIHRTEVKPVIEPAFEPEPVAEKTESYMQKEPVQPAMDEEKPRKNKKQDKMEIEDEVAAVEESIVKQESSGGRYVFPPVDLLQKGNTGASGDTRDYLNQTAAKLKETLKNFGINITITAINCGPAVTRYEFQPEMGVKVSKIVNLSDDIKMNLAAADIRIEAPIPGKAAIGIEVPNKESIPVMFRDLVESEEFHANKSPIAFAAGKDIAGKVMIADIAKMPHLLIAGATGSGKSVCINTIIMSILYRADPEDVKLIMIDPKVVELSVYNGIPHLFIPVVTDPKKAAGALHWAVAEMTDRYQKFAEYGVRDLKGYNQKIEGIKDIDDPDKPKKMPQIVIIVDELADLMMVAPGDVEDAICRLAQLARAAGIHLVIATQRPSVNVITGLIKANMPSRIAFSVTSGVDSRTILDMNGAEKLLGKGDMLYYPQGLQKPLRVQGAFVSDKEVSDVVEFLKEHNEGEGYSSDIEERMNNISVSASTGADAASGDGNDRDAYFLDAAKLLIDKDKGSIGMIQRYFKVGFNRAARIMDQLEEAGVVGPDEGTKPRQVLMSPEQLEAFIEEGN
ncbi:DNA translocase FtsK [Roseburia sp. AF22-2LB]|mgnify:CR=1 FL=1|uniref:DNA translocase FtsK n=1 Tax=unclassified Roseburia TaxID=2637578 RepID=UPI000E508075|nr:MULTISPECIES: DNA translocase FtsK [unclassified Roseburia]RGG36540.1 DNA translocase FtsK [Roseburia sp. AF22-8AC]RGG41576.1 DNA translocase FtsK [Roseburia sp. AF22-2LB]